MKIHKWKDVIEYFEETKNDHCLWNYVTALRGCDKDNTFDTWKYLITCLIRGKCKRAFDIEKTKNVLDSTNDSDLVNLLEKNVSFHWLSHSNDGLVSLGKFYEESMGNQLIHDLLFKLGESLIRPKNRLNIIIKMREIINILYEDDLKNGN